MIFGRPDLVIKNMHNVDMLFSKEELENDFSGFSGFAVSETETQLNEGRFHQGFSSSYQGFWRKMKLYSLKIDFGDYF